MPEVIGEGLEELADRIPQLSDREAANARILLEGIRAAAVKPASKAATSPLPPEPQVLDQLEAPGLTPHSRGRNHGRIHGRGA